MEGKTKNGTCKITDDAGNEDAEIGRCLESVNIHAGDSRDEEGKERFHPLNLETIITQKNIPAWYWNYKYYKSNNASEESENVRNVNHVIINHICMIGNYIINI